MRTSHSRFNNHNPVCKGQNYNRVVTSCWSYDIYTQVLRYGAAVFTKETPKSFWNKKIHRETARERYEMSPVLVKLNRDDQYDKYNKGKPRNVAIDWHIATEFIFKYQAYNLNPIGINEYTMSSEFNFKFSYLKSCSKDLKLKYTVEDVNAMLLEDRKNSENKHDGWLCLLVNVVLATACYYYL